MPHFECQCGGGGGEGGGGWAGVCFKINVFNETDTQYRIVKLYTMIHIRPFSKSPVGTEICLMKETKYDSRIVVVSF